MWVVRGAVLIGLLFLAQGCGAKWHLNRAIAKDPTILDSVVLKVDTMIITENKSIRDTIILQEYDTITLERNAVRVKIQRINDTIRIDAECLSDTIRIQEEIRVPQIIYQEKKINSKYLWILLVSIIIYTLVLLRLTK